MSIIYINPFQFAAAPSPGGFLLDDYPGAAAAYSLRQLRTGVTNVVRVRRSSDNTESDFTATEVSNGTLVAWVGAGNNGFVRTWYDQSGNARHLEQATVASQLKIVTNGSVETDGGQPAIASRGGWLTLSRTWGLTPVDPQLFLVSTVDTLYQNYNGHWVDIGNYTPFANHRNRGLYQDYFNTARPIYGGEPSPFVLGSRYLESFRYSSGSGSIYINGSFYGLNTFSLATPNSLLVGGSLNTYPAIGYVQELVIYSNGSGLNAAAIEAEINAHYSIY